MKNIMYKCLALLSLSLWAFLPALMPLDAAAQGMSGRGISGNASSQVSKMCQVEVENLRDEISAVTKELQELLACNNQGKVLSLDGVCRDIYAPAHNWSGTTLSFADARTGDDSYNWAAGVDLKGDKGPKGESITCYMPDDTPPPPPPPGNDGCNFTYLDTGRTVTVAHGGSVQAHEADLAYKGSTSSCGETTRTCNDGTMSGGNTGYENCKFCPTWNGAECEPEQGCRAPGYNAAEGETVYGYTSAWGANGSLNCRKIAYTCQGGSFVPSVSGIRSGPHKQCIQCDSPMLITCHADDGEPPLHGGVIMN